MTDPAVTAAYGTYSQECGPDLNSAVNAALQIYQSDIVMHPGVNISDGIIIQDGLAQAIQSAGRTKTFALVGNGAFAPNNTLMKEGNGQSAAVQFDTSWVAWSASLMMTSM